MAQNYSGRITVILVVLLAAIVAILWPSIANPLKVGLNPEVPFSQKHSLKPGIDISGGTSLLYLIKPPAGGELRPNLAEEVAASLKQRVDPNSVMNLIWRPQNPDKLEVQMPLTSGGEARTKALDDARAKIEATNVGVPEAMLWVEQGETRDPAALDRLAAGSPERKKILQDLAATRDRIVKLDAELKAAGAAPDAAKIAERNALDPKYNQLQADLSRTNISIAEIERRLNVRDKEGKTKAEEAIRKEVASFPDRAQGVETFIAARKALEESGGGLESAADLKRLLRGSGLLEFHIVPEFTDPGLRDARHPAGYTDWVDQLKQYGARGNPEDQYRWYEVDKPEEFKGQAVEHDGRSWMLASIKPDETLDDRTGRWKLVDARDVTNQQGQSVVSFQFDPVGARFFGELTTRHRGKQMAIMLDGKAISAPNINEPITGGSGTISGSGAGGFKPKEVKYLTSMLKAGALPATLSEEPISERTVGPQLGEDNLARGLISCLLGLIIVGIFLIGYYYLAGLIAFIGVLLNLVLLVGAMAALNATFTLPGIAAIILTVGSAVDANVLIFERLREEQHRGLSIRMAIRNAYDRAFSAIMDSNVTTIITSACLILFGTEEVKGFGLTLIIGIVTSLFTSLFVTKTIFGLLVDKFGVKRLGSLPLSIPTWDQMLRPKIRWTRKVIPFSLFSAVFILIGLVFFVKYAADGKMLDIEFASGTAVTFDIKQPQSQETIRDWIDDEAKKNPEALPAPAVVRIGTDGKTWEVTTPNANAEQVRDVILRAVGDNLDTELKIDFEGASLPFEQVIASTAAAPATSPASATAPSAGASAPFVLPLTPETLADASKWPGGIVPAEARRFTGGAALFLRGMTPAISPNEIADRVKRQRLQPQAGPASRAKGANFTVVGPNGPAGNASSAIVLVSDESRDYRRGEGAWKSDLVEPMWEIVKQGINAPSKLQQVKNFDPSVAGEVQKNAAIALFFSILFIMTYIWVRFGNLKYGTATVISLVHDVAFCFAAIGYAHLLSGNAIGEALLLQPFRISLTIIAAILTVMGYSMLDTIVVFDRIRELRGKYGHLSGGVIDDAINQTLSRTLLTAGTTIISVGIMYCIGGEGIHGFTFVLFVGILAGTYSSIAIASPILLIGAAADEVPAKGGTARTPAGQASVTT